MNILSIQDLNNIFIDSQFKEDYNEYIKSKECREFSNFIDNIFSSNSKSSLFFVK